MQIQHSAHEEETVDMLVGLMGGDFDREVARRILRKYEGDIDKTAGALLEGERGEDLPPTLLSWRTNSQMDISQPQPLPPAVRPNTPIDLTGDDDPDLQRAMQESIITIQPQPEGPKFGPSERPADPNWAVVPSHQEESHDANYLQNLERAIEASLEHNMGDSDALEPFPVEQQLRRDGCPVVLRPSMHTMVYAASILQGLFYVPQVRERMACWRPPVPPDVNEVYPPTSGADYTLWALSEIFTHMDLARLCDLNVDKRLPAFNIEPWAGLAQSPGELSRKFFAKLSATLERAFVDQFAHSGQPPHKPRLLHFQYGSSVSEPGELLQETSIVPIDVHATAGSGNANDLIGRLSAQLSKPQSYAGKQSVIFEPSEVVAFELSRASPAYPNSTSTGGDRVERKPFTFPASIYLDQFLRDNVGFAQAKRRQQEEMTEEVQRLILHKKTLTHFEDTLKDLRSTIFYFENIADAKGDLERASAIQTTATKLKSILDTIEQEIKTTDHTTNTLRTEAATLLDCPELQQVRYDLRVVFMHDGLYGRKHLYSYVHDRSSWWKIADSLIEKVSEEVVLNDHAGLHLGAGPYLLFYSRALPENVDPTPSLPWPEDIKDDVKAANKEFLSQLPPELVTDIIIAEDSPLGSPAKGVLEVPSSDQMDMS
ncbi:hypothetical protein BDN67DRAFT_737341 [Paxillus ammoniavirescens]|nr:hypothetical protein BDN67DRAFT_737341 [Paxillus ammoniavirescens]